MGIDTFLFVFVVVVAVLVVVVHKNHLDSIAALRAEFYGLRQSFSPQQQNTVVAPQQEPAPVVAPTEPTAPTAQS